jgi:23S rRNA U2552 (ribose-2'-O)-methylase RlmE/FtsJ
MSLLLKRFKSITNKNAWLQRKQKDKFSKNAITDNYRSRAAYKIIEIDKKFKVFGKQKSTLDIGAAPVYFVIVRHEKS